MMSLRKRFRWFLAPSIFQAILSIAVLPIATLVLGPSDYGAFAVVSAIAGVATALATSAAGMILPAHYSTLDEERLGGLVQALLYSALGIGIGLGALMVLLAVPIL